MKIKRVFIIFLFLFTGLITASAFANSDLTITNLPNGSAAGGLTFSNYTVRGSTLTITATVKNVGNTDAAPVAIFFDSSTISDPNAYTDGTFDTVYVTSRDRYAQSFQVYSNSQLLQISIYGHDNTSNGYQPLVIDLKNDDGYGNPGATIDTQQASGAATDHWQNITFSDTLVLGKTYWISIYTNSSSHGWMWWEDDNNTQSYNGIGIMSQSSDSGNTWSQYSTDITAFRMTFVNPIQVTFTDTPPSGSGANTVQISTTQIISAIASNTSQAVSVPWCASPGGVHQITAQVTYPGYDLNLANNTTNYFFSVSTAPPSAIHDLTALTYTGSQESDTGKITLQWTAPGEDNMSGTVSKYILKYSGTGPITNSSFETATTYYYAWNPSGFAPGGTQQSIVVTGLTNSATYWFALLAMDGDPNPSYNHWSQWYSNSDVPGYNTMCSTQPYDITPNPPTWPTPPNLSVRGSTQCVDLAWLAPATPPIEGISGYNIYCDSSSETAFNPSHAFLAGTVGPGITSYHLSGLTNFNTYWYAITTLDQGPVVFESPYSVSKSTGLILPVLPIPMGFTGTTLSASSIKWTWNPVSNANGFNIYWNLDGYTTPIDVAPAGSTQWIENSNLTANTTYFQSIQAFNQFGSSPTNTSDIVFATSTLALPPTGTNLFSAPVTSYSVTIAWTNPNPADGQYTNTTFGILRSANNWTTSISLLNYTSGYTQTTYTDAGLNNSTTYWYKVQAYNNNGVPTTFDNIVSTCTLPPPPAPFSSFTGTAISQTAIDWNWVESSITNTNYFSIYSSTGGLMNSSPLNPNTTHFITYGLNLNTQYTMSCAAINVTTTVFSSPASRYTLANVPGANSIVSVSSYSVSFQWNPNSDPSPATTYGALRADDSGFTINVTTVSAAGQTTTSITDTSLTSLKYYYYKVCAYNGDNIQTAYNVYISTETWPPPPGPFSFTGTAISTTNITWNWTSSQYATSYLAHDITKGTSFGTAGNSWTELNLTVIPNTSFYAFCEAINITTSTFSNFVTSSTLANPPVNSFVTNVTSYSLCVNWSNNVNPPYTRYGIYHSLDNSNWTALTNFSSIYTTLSATDTAGAFPLDPNSSNGLAASTTYYYKITAFNNDGIETLLFTSTSAVTKPAPPTSFNFFGTAESTTSINWNWTSSTFVSSYTVFDITPTAASSATYNTAWLQQGLSINQRYTAFADASNVTAVTFSNSISSYTLANPPLEINNASTFHSFVSVSSNVIKISWDPNSDPEANPNFTYWGIFRSDNDDQFVTSTNTLQSFSNKYKTVGYTDTAQLQPATTYSYNICAFNGDGIPAFGIMITTVTKPAPPNGPLNLTGVALSTSSIQWSWVDNSTNEDGFDVKTTTDTPGIVIVYTTTAVLGSGTTMTWIEGTPQTTQALTPPPLCPNTSYYRVADAYNNVGYNNSNSTITYTWALPPTGTYVISVASSSVTLGWSTNTDPYAPTFWGIIYSTDPLFTSAMTAVNFSNGVRGSSGTAAGLTSQTTYWFKVCAYNGDGIPTPFDVAVETVTIPGPPNPPINFFGTALSTSSIVWSWIDNSVNETGFRIKDSSTSVIISTITSNTILGTGTTYTWEEDGLSVNTQYNRYCEAYNENGTGVSKSTATYTLANPTTGSYIIAVDSSTIQMGWFADGNPGYTDYGIIRSVDNFFLTTTTVLDFSSAFSSTTYLDKNLTVYTTYYYRTLAYNGDGIPTLYDVTISTRTRPLAPRAPTNFKGVAASSYSICWSWTDNSPNYEDGFLLYVYDQYANRMTTYTYSFAEQPYTNTVYTGGMPPYGMNSPYTGYVKMYNVTGTSASNSDTRYTLANPPTQSLTSAGSPTFHTVLINWDKPCATKLGIAYSSSTSGSIPCRDYLVRGATISSITPEWQYDTWDNNVATPTYKIKSLQLNTTYSFVFWGYNHDQVPSFSTTTITGYTIDLPPTTIKILDPYGAIVQISSFSFAGSTLTFRVDLPANTVSEPAYVWITTSALTNLITEDPNEVATATKAIGQEKGRHLLEPYVTEFDLFNFVGSTLAFNSGPATITIPYADANNDGRVDDPITHYKVSTLFLATLDRLSQTWMEVPGWTTDKVNKNFSVKTPHFSLYSLASYGPAGGNYARLYPNPFKPNSGLGHTVINFANLVPGSTIRVFNIAGQLVWIKENVPFETYVWDAKNPSGNTIVSGVYIYVIIDPSGSKDIGNFSIIR
jgi:hypothetical protein